jgi:hypothetical protein
MTRQIQTYNPKNNAKSKAPNLGEAKDQREQDDLGEFLLLLK